MPGGGDLLSLVEKSVTWDRDAMGAEGVASDRRREIEQKNEFEVDFQNDFDCNSAATQVDNRRDQRG